MTNTATPTTRVPFYTAPVVRKGHCLFSVEPGTPADLALENAGSMLNAARDTLHSALMQIAPSREATIAWTSLYVIEQVSAPLDAIQLDGLSDNTGTIFNANEIDADPDERPEDHPWMQIDPALVLRYREACSNVDREEVTNDVAVDAFRTAEFQLLKAIHAATRLEWASLKTYGELSDMDGRIWLFGQGETRVLSIGDDGSIRDETDDGSVSTPPWARQKDEKGVAA